jgi:hypothetical protein
MHKLNKSNKRQGNKFFILTIKPILIKIYGSTESGTSTSKIKGIIC